MWNLFLLWFKNYIKIKCLWNHHTLCTCIKTWLLAAQSVLSDEWHLLFQIDCLCDSFPQSVFCCFVFAMSDMGALLWRSQWGQWGYDRFTHHHDDHKHMSKLINTVKLKETFKCTMFLFLNIDCVSPLTVWMSFFHSDSSLFTSKLPLLKSPSVKIKSFSHTINIHTGKLICWISFSLTAHSH